jgi:hypothetical protein
VRPSGLPILLVLLVPLVSAQQWDLPARAAESLPGRGKLKLSVDVRARYESRTGTSFGKDPDVDTGLVRTRLGLTYTPRKWLKLFGMAQDVRAPWYGSKAPENLRDQADLHDAYVELFPGYQRGFGMIAGRKSLVNYGDGRLIGISQWSNTARTYDYGSVQYRLPGAQLEMLFISPVKVRIGEFNRPVLGDRLWGFYNSFPGFYRKNLLELYVLRHEQNRPGGFTGGSRAEGTDRLGVTGYGFRLTGPAAIGSTYTVEAVAESGKVGPADFRATAWVATVARRWEISTRTLDVLCEYKFASGTANPADPSRSGTFDQFYGVNHDKFGHEDLLGWRNLHDARSLATLAVTRALAVNFMYNNYWLACVRDGLYNGSGKSIARSADGSAGRHVGQEADLFATYRYRHFLFGAGYGHMFAGEFLRKATPGAGPTYMYLFHSYAF